jgi:enoyl-CoA hydratase/carnithine racemase
LPDDTGFQLALACDLRVIIEDARFAIREPTLGLVPDLGGIRPLVEILGEYYTEPVALA